MSKVVRDNAGKIVEFDLYDHQPSKDMGSSAAIAATVPTTPGEVDALHEDEVKMAKDRIAVIFRSRMAPIQDSVADFTRMKEDRKQKAKVHKQENLESLKEQYRQACELVERSYQERVAEANRLFQLEVKPLNDVAETIHREWAEAELNAIALAEKTRLERLAALTEAERLDQNKGAEGRMVGTR